MRQQPERAEPATLAKMIRQAKRTELEDRLWFQMQGAARYSLPVRELRFLSNRAYRADFGWPDRFLLLEVEGGTWTQGRHARGSGMRKDAEKYNEAVIHGWRVLRVTTDMIRDGSAISLVLRALAAFQPMQEKRETG